MPSPMNSGGAITLKRARIGPRHGVGAGRELAQLRGMPMARVGPQFEARSIGFAHGLQPVLGNTHQDLEFVGAGDPHDALALRHDLADLGLDRGDDARRVGAQLGVGELFSAEESWLRACSTRASVVAASDWRCSSVCGVNAPVPRRLR